jgi:hypothetical protein
MGFTLVKPWAKAMPLFVNAHTLSQKVCDKLFFFFQLVDAGVDFSAAEIIQ